MKIFKTEELNDFPKEELIKLILLLQNEIVAIRKDNEMLRAEVARIKKSRAGQR